MDNGQRRLGWSRQLRDEWKHNKRDWTLPGFRAMVMYRFGAWGLQHPSPLVRRLTDLPYRWMHRYVRNHYGIELHRTAKLGRRVVIAHQGGIVIHPYAEIGEYTRIHQGVTLGGVNQFSPENAPKLGAHVKVGAGAVIAGNVRVGEGATVGPNVVVIKDVPPGATVFPAPPRQIVPPPATGTTTGTEVRVEG